MKPTCAIYRQWIPTAAGVSRDDYGIGLACFNHHNPGIGGVILPEWIKQMRSVMVSIGDFDSSGLGSNPDASTKPIDGGKPSARGQKGDSLDRRAHLITAK